MRSCADYNRCKVMYAWGINHFVLVIVTDIMLFYCYILSMIIKTTFAYKGTTVFHPNPTASHISTDLRLKSKLDYFNLLWSFGQHSIPATFHKLTTS